MQNFQHLINLIPYNAQQLSFVAGVAAGQIPYILFARLQASNTPGVSEAEARALGWFCVISVAISAGSKEASNYLQGRGYRKTGIFCAGMSVGTIMGAGIAMQTTASRALQQDNRPEGEESSTINGSSNETAYRVEL